MKESSATRDPDALLERAGVRGNPDRDQHFLIDDRVLDRLPTYLDCDRVSPEWRTHVLEIGAGTGALTDRLLAVAEHVTAIERDDDLVSFLRTEFGTEIAEERLTVIGGDALDREVSGWTASVSNLPYGVSSEIAFELLPEKNPLALMFQREFAERMAASPGEDSYGRLSVTAQHFGSIEVVEIVPPTAFSPQPAVESAVVRVIPRDPSYTVSDEDFFLRFVTAVFTQRRKTIRNAIRNTAHISKLDDPDAVVENIDDQLLQRRAGVVSSEDFASMAEIARTVGCNEDDDEFE